MSFMHDKRSTSGMTMLEVVAVVAILGVLAAIAAPSWLAFANRQRANRATDQVLQSIRTAQSDAKRTRRNRTVEFKPNAGNIPEIVTGGVSTRLGEGDLTANMVSLSMIDEDGNLISNAADQKLTFMSNGGLQPGNLPTIIVKVPAEADNPVKKCVIVRSLLGATEIGSGDECGS